MISDSEINDNCALPGYYAASSGNYYFPCVITRKSVGFSVMESSQCVKNYLNIKQRFVNGFKIRVR